ncbi:GNAT family N-acetyltransferase [Ruegeria sp. 2012CJ41-6]|uniref:GNAT family N-acetyltransferase n=1 Tax=Ruegeria spongiae TaxID=2942209 RepID=A0ABT0PXR7_9RHOB|nr:GNAT family N-acetyltransferase [Ruegeria spongiae]MCL6281957.1 GNAT family N-acetyltransferase [Ruegeria spongiae]
MNVSEMRGDGFVIVPMVRDDFDALYLAASDPLIWAGHPATTRAQKEVFGPYFDFLLGAGGAVTVREEGTDRVIGCSRFYEPPEVPGGIGIGYSFITRDHWGGTSNRAIKGLMLERAFQERKEVWFHIDPGNLRSQKGTAKLGARHVDNRLIDLDGVTTQWMRWVLTEESWLECGVK